MYWILEDFSIQMAESNFGLFSLAYACIYTFMNKLVLLYMYWILEDFSIQMAESNFGQMHLYGQTRITQPLTFWVIPKVTYHCKMVPNVTKGDMSGFSSYSILVSQYIFYILYLCHNIYFLYVDFNMFKI